MGTLPTANGGPWAARRMGSCHEVSPDPRLDCPCDLGAEWILSNLFLPGRMIPDPGASAPMAITSAEIFFSILMSRIFSKLFMLNINNSLARVLPCAVAAISLLVRLIKVLRFGS